MDTKFSEWLNAQMHERGWSMSELGRRAGVSHAQISNVINGIKPPGSKVCKGIARAFGLRDIEVLRLAGIADPEPPTDTPRLREMNVEFAQLSEDDQGFWLRAIRGYNAEKRQRGKTGKPD